MTTIIITDHDRKLHGAVSRVFAVLRKRSSLARALDALPERPGKIRDEIFADLKQDFPEPTP